MFSPLSFKKLRNKICPFSILKRIRKNKKERKLKQQQNQTVVNPTSTVQHLPTLASAPPLDVKPSPSSTNLSSPPDTPFISTPGPIFPDFEVPDKACIHDAEPPTLAPAPPLDIKPSPSSTNPSSPPDTPFVSTPGPIFPDFEVPDKACIHDAEPTLQDLVLGYGDALQATLPAEDSSLISEHKKVQEPVTAIKDIPPSPTISLQEHISIPSPRDSVLVTQETVTQETVSPQNGEKEVEHEAVEERSIVQQVDMPGEPEPIFVPDVVDVTIAEPHSIEPTSSEPESILEQVSLPAVVTNTEAEAEHQITQLSFEDQTVLDDFPVTKEEKEDKEPIMTQSPPTSPTIRSPGMISSGTNILPHSSFSLLIDLYYSFS